MKHLQVLPLLESKNACDSSSLSEVTENSTCNSEDPEASSGSSISGDPEAMCSSPSHPELLKISCFFHI